MFTKSISRDAGFARTELAPPDQSANKRPNVINPAAVDQAVHCFDMRLAGFDKYYGNVNPFGYEDHDFINPSAPELLLILRRNPKLTDWLIDTRMLIAGSKRGRRLLCTNRQEFAENGVRHGIAVALLPEDRERLTRLQDRLRATNLGREVFSHIGFPVSATHTIIRQLQESGAEIVIVDVPSQSPQRAIRAIELIRATTEVAIFATGVMTQPANIVASMRNGASEYVDRSAGHEALLESFDPVQFLAHSRVGKCGQRSRIHIPQCQGRLGMAAVNTALALQGQIH